MKALLRGGRVLNLQGVESLIPRNRRECAMTLTAHRVLLYIKRVPLGHNKGLCLFRMGSPGQKMGFVGGGDSLLDGGGTFTLYRKKFVCTKGRRGAKVETEVTVKLWSSS